MFNERDHLQLKSIGIQKRRSYYIPFDCNDEVKYNGKIIDRTSSSRFISLDGEWSIKEFRGLHEIDLDAKSEKKIIVPSCVQLQGFDQIQYLNERYPFFYEPPFISDETPVYKYEKQIVIENLSEKYYINFEGVDSGFYLYVNKQKVGYGQIAHSTNEFDITDFLREGKNLIEVLVFKWTAGSYLECQDKFRFTGIFRSIYLLRRPSEHILDYKIETEIIGNTGIITLKNESEIDIEYQIEQENGIVLNNQSKKITIKNAHFWSAENPFLYTLKLFANGETIIERVGIRTVNIQNGIFKINGKHIKLKGVNRHEFNEQTGATVSISDMVKDFELMKWANVNAIRTAHYPDMPEFYALADEYGFYVIDEADVETHGAFNVDCNLGFSVIVEEANNPVFFDGVFEREVALVERDKNRCCVVMWSLGNEAAYGKMFYQGADYIHARDSRPIQYQAIESIRGSEEFYTNRIDVLGCFYPELKVLDDYLADEKEKRPIVLIEYLHAMGNSCGGLKDYWEKLYSNDRFIGAFVWEWCDHAIKTQNGYLYGSDFGETEHDLNFCVDGLVFPDRRIKSNLLELKAVYSPNFTFDEFLPEGKALPCAKNDNPIKYNVDRSGKLISIGNLIFDSPLEIQIMRAYIDNDNRYKNKWIAFENATMQAYSIEKIAQKTIAKGRLVKNCMRPIMQYELEYIPFNDGIDIAFRYKVADFIDFLPRIGLRFALKIRDAEFSYVGYGPCESYIDKHCASKYANYISSASKNYTDNIMPQETGSHFATTLVEIEDLIQISAQDPFSFNILPYSTEQLTSAKHHFELIEEGKTFVNIDVEMSGVGTASCGPELPIKYRAKKSGQNIFRIVLKRS